MSELTHIKASMFSTAFDLVTKEYVGVRLESFSYADDGSPKAVFVVRDQQGRVIGKRGECDLSDFCL